MSPPRQPLPLPAPHQRVLLHSCCAPCSGEVMQAMSASGIDYAIYFYNPNIHPSREYDIRKQENIRFARQHGIEFIDADYDVDNWFARVKGLEHAPERGERCTMSSNSKPWKPTSPSAAPRCWGWWSMKWTNACTRSVTRRM